MTTTNTELPKVLRVTSGTIHIPFDYECEDLEDYERVNRNVTHLLALIPDDDKEEAELEDDGFDIITSNVPALKYACKHYFLNDFNTLVDAIFEQYKEDDICCDCIESIVDEAVRVGYTSQVLSDGVYLVKEEV